MDNLNTISNYIRSKSIHAIHDHIRDGIVSEAVADVLIDTMSAVNRDFLMLLHIPKEQRNVFIIKLAQEIYLQWVEHGIIQDSVIAIVDEYAYQDEWRNEGREIGDSQ